jgi:CBS domain-containing protein
MASVADVLALKGPRVYSIHPSTTILDATRLMNRHKIGSLVVTEGPMHTEDNQCAHVVGMFTERDVLTRVVAQQRDPAATFVGEVMTSEIAFCRPDDDLDVVAAMMRERRIRHMPVCDGEGELLGLISIGDLNAWRAQGQEVEITYLHEYIYGRV